MAAVITCLCRIGTNKNEEYSSVFAICFGILVGWLADYPRRKLGFDEFTAHLTKVRIEYQKKWPNWVASLIGGIITLSLPPKTAP